MKTVKNAMVIVVGSAIVFLLLTGLDSLFSQDKVVGWSSHPYDYGVFTESIGDKDFIVFMSKSGDIVVFPGKPKFAKEEKRDGYKNR